MNKKHGFGKKIGEGLGRLAVVAATAAASYYFFGAEGKKHRKELRDWNQKAKIEMLGKIKAMKRVSKHAYETAAKEVLAKYRRAKNIHPEEIAALGMEFKKQWDNIYKEINKLGKTAAPAKKRTKKKRPPGKSMPIRNQTTLYFIRHGETVSNKNHIRQGVKINDYLDTRGILQARQVAKLIQYLRLDILFTSYLLRAEETAAIINQNLKTPLPILHDYRLRERDFGSLSGKSQQEWDDLLPNNRELEALQMYDYRPFGGENVDDVRQRAVSAILDMAENYDHENIGIVTHNGIIRLLLFHFPSIPRIYRGKTDSKKDITNSDIYEWEITEGRIANLKSLLKNRP